jgi:hypothetical protein
MRDKNTIKQAASIARWSNAPDRSFPANATIDPEFMPYAVRYTWRQNDNGYFFTRVAKRAISLHRFVWRLKFGSLPKELDHINRDRTDCRLCNLRPATRSMNTSGNGRPGRSLPRGVTKRNEGLWEVRFRNKRLGYFKSIQAASDAYEAVLADYIKSEMEVACAN